MARILVVGPVSAGKTALAKTLAQRTDSPHIELDHLRFSRDWTQVPDEQFREIVGAVAAKDQWIIDGNYASVRDLLWKRAETVVWLDFSLATVLRRLVSRTLRRVLFREDLGGGRRERIGRLVGRRSILTWAVRSHGPLRAEYERAGRIYGGRVNVVRLRSPAASDAWVASITGRI